MFRPSFVIGCSRSCLVEFLEAVSYVFLFFLGQSGFHPLLLWCYIPIRFYVVISSLPAIFHWGLSLLSLLGFLSFVLFLSSHILLLPIERSSGPPGILFSLVALVVSCLSLHAIWKAIFAAFFLSFPFFVFSSVGLRGLSVLVFVFTIVVSSVEIIAFSSLL